MNESLTFTIKEIAIQTGITEDNIRYYEKIGLLPQAKRKPNSHRLYDLKDVEIMRMLICFKKTGMSLESMKPFLQLTRDEDLTAYPELVSLVNEHKVKIEKQINSLQQIVDFLDIKLRSGNTSMDNQPCTLAEPEKRSPSMPRLFDLYR